MSVAEELEKRLHGGKFRLMNEKMYKKKALTKDEAKRYHEYYEEQVKRWPSDPKQAIIERINNSNPYARIADLGCGTAEMRKHFKNVSSFDKHPVDESIQQAELDALPASDGEYDIAVCCLSLMMNYVSRVIRETNRILKIGGEFYLAEVRSRIVNTKTLISNIEKFGYSLKEVDCSNTHFVILVFTKVSEYNSEKRMPEVKLKPCLYKKR